MSEPLPPRSSRRIWILLAAPGVVLAIGVVLTRVDLCRHLSPILAGNRR